MKTSSCKSFTLIELLVVIAIIAILAGLVFPAIGTVRNNAKKSKASSEAQSLKAAIVMYESEFSIWPATVSEDGIVKDGKNSDYSKMCNALTGENAKKMVFFEVGSTYDESMGILDPWGRQYQVILDGNYDGKIKNDVVDNENKKVVWAVDKYYGKNNGQDIRTKVAVFSYGVPESKDPSTKNSEELAKTKKLVISW